MSLYISPANEYPRFIGDIWLTHPDFKFGDELPEGWKLVTAVDYPEHTEDETVEEQAPKLVDGVLTQNFVIRPLTAEELERRDAPKTAKAKLVALGLTEFEIEALLSGLVR